MRTWIVCAALLVAAAVVPFTQFWSLGLRDAMTGMRLIECPAEFKGEDTRNGCLAAELFYPGEPGAVAYLFRRPWFWFGPPSRQRSWTLPRDLDEEDDEESTRGARRSSKGTDL